MKIKEKIIRYIDAGFPILYINSYEEEKVDKIITESASGRIIYEWNGVSGFSDFMTKKSLNLSDSTLQGTLQFLINSNDIDGSIIVLKDVQSMMDSPDIISLLKYIACRISNGSIETTIIIESSVKLIPKELEPYITLLEMDYLTTNDIKMIIKDFVEFF